MLDDVEAEGEVEVQRKSEVGLIAKPFGTSSFGSIQWIGRFLIKLFVEIKLYRVMFKVFNSFVSNIGDKIVV